jgi:hypothetical protein
MTFMLEPAKLQMNCASARGMSTLRNALDGRPAVLASATLHLLPHQTGDVSAARPPGDGVHAAQPSAWET